MRSVASPIRKATTGLDYLRSRVLRYTLAWKPLRHIFCNRAHRLFALYVVFIALALVVSCLVPLWQLLLGPMIYGYMHLFSSVRYFHYGVSKDAQVNDQNLKKLAIGTLLSLATLYCLYRAALASGVFPGVQARLSEWQGSAINEAVFVGMVFFVGALVYRKRISRVLFGALLLGPLAYALIMHSAATVGFLVLGHNAVGFIYWLLACRTKQDRGYALAAFGLFILVNVAIFSGFFDPVYALFAHSESLGFAGLTNQSMGALIVPWSGDANLRFHAVAALAFGQSTHYYVWLKAIPDQHHYHRIPTSFRQSYRLLGSDFGKPVAAIMIYAIVAVTLVWIFVSMRDARAIYFMVAGFHGYLEIAGLGLISPRRKAEPVAELAT